MYHFAFTPARAGTYSVFTEIVPLRSRRQAIALSSMEVAGESLQLEFERSNESVVNGIHFQIEGAPEVLKTGRDYRLELSVLTESGAPVELETVMGAKGHMVAFDAEGKGYTPYAPG